MTMFSRSGLRPLTLLAIAACSSDGASSAIAPVDPLVTRTARAATEQSLTGHAEFINPRNGNRVKMSVNAIRHVDGTTTGKVEQHIDIASTGQFIRRAHSTVLCLTVVGNVARYGAVIDRIEGAGAPAGTEIVGTAIDNGEGNNDAPDMATPTAPGSAAAHCLTGIAPPLPLFAVEHGNIQVRP
jgi:hypothetical protein